MEHLLQSIRRALQTIEDHLEDPIDGTDLARTAGLSFWHFQRTFTALAGEPVGRYIRRRRLTEAAFLLRQDPACRVLDAAIRFRFDSHEAFTRAFVAAFGLTPSAWRRLRRIDRIRTRPPLDPAALRLLPSTIMKPNTTTLPALHLIGLETRFISAASADSNNMEVIPALWDRFIARAGEITPAGPEGVSYGACRCLPPDEKQSDDEFLYLAGRPASEDAPVPAGMVRWSVPASTYAVFTHRGPISRIGETMTQIYGSALPRSGLVHSGGIDLERYDERFKGEHPQSELDILIPVRGATSAESG